MSKTLLSLLLAVPAFLPAATIFSSISSTQGVTSGSVGAGFALSSTWNNVLIRMDLATNIGPAGSSVTAFLTSSLGPGATNIVPSAVIPVPNVPTTQTLFSLPTLGPGNYFFSILPADGLTGALGGGAIAPIVLGPGVTSLGLFTLAGPAPTGNPSPSTFGLRFVVTGDPDTTIPEPGTLGLFTAGAVILAAAYRKRK
ncbi:MAG: PEP-CTERM sorting domain-containing protein [Acidobacteria bacterium]|nr:PEP-CTERM sorting domain-containing protein [Acidobacteriota bacterium]